MDAIALPDKEAISVALALFKVNNSKHNESLNSVTIIVLQVFMKIGLCRVVTSDQGKEFNNHLNAELDIDHRLTTPYHPQVRVTY